MLAAYDRHIAQVRAGALPGRLLEWRAAQGWEPIYRAFGLPVPDQPFPWVNRRGEWG